jgi:hypothetical protein
MHAVLGTASGGTAAASSTRGGGRGGRHIALQGSASMLQVVSALLSRQYIAADALMALEVQGGEALRGGELSELGMHAYSDPTDTKSCTCELRM